MTEDPDTPLPPTFIKVLDAFLADLKDDEQINDESAQRLIRLLKKGKTPKQEQIEKALFPISSEETDEDGSEETSA